MFLILALALTLSLSLLPVPGNINVVNKWNSGVLSRDWLREFKDVSVPDLDCGSFELRRAGVDAATLRRAGYTVEELRAGMYTEEELLNAGYNK